MDVIQTAPPTDFVSSKIWRIQNLIAPITPSAIDALFQMLSLEISGKPCAVSRAGSEISATVKLGNVERETIVDLRCASSGVIGEI